MGIVRAPRTRWATGPDRAVAGLRYIGLLSDLDVPGAAVLSDSLATIAGAGPHTRVGLTPQPGNWRWAYDPAAVPPVRTLPEAVANDDAAAVLQYIRRRPGARRPLEVHASDRQIAIDADHRLGDGRFVLDIFAAIFAVADGRPSSWVSNGDTRLALPRALIRTFGIHPSRARAARRYAADLRSSRALPPDAGSGDSTAWSPSFAVTVAHVDADAESAVDEWRRANTQKLGSAAVWLYLVRRALRAAGLQMTDEIMVSFDCRRYLPLSHSVNGNFVVGVEIPLATDDGVSIVDSRMRGCISSTVPLAAMGVLSARSLLQRGSIPVTSPSHTVGTPASVMYTDMSRISAFDELPWRGPDKRDFTGLLDLGGPEGVTVFTTTVDGARNISISFHDNVFDRSVMDAAAEYLKHPMRLLTGGASRQ